MFYTLYANKYYYNYVNEVKDSVYIKIYKLSLTNAIYIIVVLSLNSVWFKL